MWSDRGMEVTLLISISCGKGVGGSCFVNDMFIAARSGFGMSWNIRGVSLFFIRRDLMELSTFLRKLQWVSKKSKPFMLLESFTCSFGRYNFCLIIEFLMCRFAWTRAFIMSTDFPVKFLQLVPGFASNIVKSFF